MDAEASAASRCGWEPATCGGADRGLPRPPRSGHDPDVRRPRRAGAGRAVGAGELLRVPATSTSATRAAGTRPRTSTPPRPGRCATRFAADTVLALARAARGPPRQRVEVDRPIGLVGRLPAAPDHAGRARAPERRIVVAAVCGARPLAEGRPPMGSGRPAGRRADLPAGRGARGCLEDFLEVAGEHAREEGERLTIRRPRSSASSSSRATTSEAG